MESVRVPGFLPSANGLRFPNAFARSPFVAVGPVKIGDVSGGLCGGMVFDVLDRFESKVPPPPDVDVPRAGSPLFRRIRRRAWASFGVPVGPARYYLWQLLPDRTVARWSAGRSWRAIRADVAAGRPSPLGLVRVRSANPLALGRDHQVLAYGFDQDRSAGTLRILVYDPNHPGDDAVAIEVTGTNGPHATAVSYLEGEDPVRGFFRSRYRSKPVSPSG